MTTPERWARIERLYHEALACAAPERAPFLTGACAGDDALRREVESLIEHDGGAAFLSTPAVATVIVGALHIGQALGPYVISAQIGEGGMGEVYRARDSNLGRDVAIKMLPRVFTADPDRLARFEREARLLASLNHPHIGAIYGVEESAGSRALVLEMVEGLTLAETLAGHQAKGEGLPVGEALAIAVQIADALDAAHERGIVHRDLKPANIKITPAGTVKILDFGLAKMVAGDGSSPDLSRGPTLDIAGTRDGMILGTAAYMSPEQARGQTVDKRTDIWAFGCVLHEILTGRPAFARSTISDTIAAVLTQEPDWTVLARTTPPHLSRLLKRCLAKDPARRQRDIGDARLDLARRWRARRSLERGGLPLHGRAWIAGAGAAVVGMMVAAFSLGVFLRPATGPPAQISRRPLFRVAPSGHDVLSQRGDHVPRLVAGRIAAGIRRPRASGSSSHLASAHLRPRGARRARHRGRPVGLLVARRSIARVFCERQAETDRSPRWSSVPLCDVPALSAFGTWGSDGTILFATFVGDAIFSVSSAGGTPEAIVTPDPSRGERVVWPSFLPDGKRFLYLSQLPNITGQLMLGARGRAPRAIVSAVSNVQWVDPDYLVFAQEGVLVAQRFDLANERVVGAPTSIAEPVDRFLSSGRAMFTTSRNGTIAYHSYANVARLVWEDRSGKEIGTVGAPGNYFNVRLSPDGGRVLFNRTTPGLGTWDLWTTDLARGVETRLTSGLGSEAMPVWQPDGHAILFSDEKYSTGNLNLARKQLDTAKEEPLLPNGTQQRRPVDVSPDGRTLLFTERMPRGTFNIFALPLDGRAKPSALFGSRFNETDPRFSPDGRSMSFASNESGRAEVYVAPVPPTGGKTLVSAGISTGIDHEGGARWSRDGRELFYVSSDRRLMAVSVRTMPMIEVGTPVPLFTFQGRAWLDFAVSTDGKRFLAVVPQAFAGEQPLTVILNWTAEVRR